MKKSSLILSALILLSLGGCVFVIIGGLSQVINPSEPEVKVREQAILQMDLDGVILDSQEFIEDLRKYAKEENIKGVLIRVNSPGGVVAPSQEIYTSILRVREELQKPVVISANSLMASGAYYAAVAADKIFVNPGTLMGSIGVIMEFANLEELYSWAKIKRFQLVTGKYKNTGTDTREMRDDEKELLQSMLNEVLEQFREAVSKGREMKMSKVIQYSDGRIFTGQKGVELGFADAIGDYQAALRDLGEMTNLGAEPKVIKPYKARDFFLMLQETASRIRPETRWIEEKLGLQLLGKPLFLHRDALVR